MTHGVDVRARAHISGRASPYSRRTLFLFFVLMNNSASSSYATLALWKMCFSLVKMNISFAVVRLLFESLRSEFIPVGIQCRSSAVVSLLSSSSVTIYPTPTDYYHGISQVGFEFLY